MSMLAICYAAENQTDPLPTISWDDRRRTYRATTKGKNSHRSFDCASRDETARGSAQDDTLKSGSLYMWLYVAVAAV